ncbi:hypothetical protein SELMODRAFT_429568 [Selaginella moellendorffii]|uniref:Malectin domain-containing protein n=1 Tax=Selaginella moellendorffii TaxID=88036 RepID=D8T6L4_SELML|nr:hypothetical protein SELMODRAFT_429568 [Selaginella moellendorffii]
MRSGSYTVHLHFAEIIIDTGQDGPGVGIQGDRKLKDFNIREEANGSLRALRRSFTVVNVSNGVRDIHLLGWGKEHVALHSDLSGPLISTIQVLPEFETGGTSQSENSSKCVKIGVGVSVPLVVLFMVSELNLLDGKLHMFSYNEIKNATGGFDPLRLLGTGAFGKVYKGVLSDGTVVAIKQLNRITGDVGYLPADVYSFGVLVLEIVSGRTNLDTTSEDMTHLLDHYQSDKLLQLLDKRGMLRRHGDVSPDARVAKQRPTEPREPIEQRPQQQCQWQHDRD